MDLQEEILKLKSDEMARGIDFEVWCSLLGYIEIVVDPWVHNSQQEIQTWVENNIQDDYYNSGNRWLFKLSKDATIFALRWG
jgi:hypothetical protein